MYVELRFIPFREGYFSHIGQGYTKSECLNLIGDAEPNRRGIYEFIVHDHKTTIYASTAKPDDIEKTLNKIFK